MTFDEQVAALRGKVEPKCFRGRKASATPEQWAANLDHFSRLRQSKAPEVRARDANYQRSYREENRGKEAARIRAWLEANRGKVAAYKREYYRDRRGSDLSYRLTSNLRRRLHHSILGNFKSGSAVRDLGCTSAELCSHIERQWYGGMTWEAWGKGPGKWQIDHIYPLAKADLADRVQFLAVCNWRNLRPLWHDDHAPKGDTITPEAQALFDSLMAEFKAKEVA
jgi:hypothetical protein